MAIEAGEFFDVEAVAYTISGAAVRISPLLNRFLANPESKDYTTAPGQRGIKAAIVLMNRAIGEYGYTAGSEPTRYRQIHTDIQINHMEKSTRSLGLEEKAAGKLPNGTPANASNFSKNFADQAARTLAMRTEYDLTRHFFSTGVGFEIDANSEIIAGSIKPVTTSGPLFYHGNADQDLTNDVIRDALVRYDVQVGEPFQKELAIPPAMANQVSAEIGLNKFAPEFIQRNLFNSEWAMGRLSSNEMVFKLTNNPLHLAGLDTGKDLTIDAVDSANGFKEITLSGGTVSSTVENLNVGDIGTVIGGGVSSYKVFGNVDSGYAPQFVVESSDKSNAQGVFKIRVRTNGNALWTWNQKDQEVQLTSTIVGKKIRFEKSHIAGAINYNPGLILAAIPLPSVGNGVMQFTSTAPGTKFPVQVTQLLADGKGDSNVDVFKANIWYGAYMYPPMCMRLIGKIPSGLSAPIASAVEEFERLNAEIKNKRLAGFEAQKLQEMRGELASLQEKYDLEVMAYKQKMDELALKVDEKDAEMVQMRKDLDRLLHKK